MDSGINWDRREHRRRILASQGPLETDLLVFDDLDRARRVRTIPASRFLMALA